MAPLTGKGRDIRRRRGREIPRTAVTLARREIRAAFTGKTHVEVERGKGVFQREINKKKALWVYGPVTNAKGDKVFRMQTRAGRGHSPPLWESPVKRALR